MIGFLGFILFLLRCFDLSSRDAMRECFDLCFGCHLSEGWLIWLVTFGPVGRLSFCRSVFLSPGSKKKFI